MSAITVVRLPFSARQSPVERVITTIARSDLDLADTLHQSDAIRPYSVVVRAHALDVVAFEDTLALALLRGDTQAKLVTRVDIGALTAPTDAALVRLAFETPTHFRVAGYEHQLPDAFSLLGSLRTRWDALGLPSLPDIRLYRLPVWPERLQFARMAAAGQAQRGFVGVVHLDLRPLDSDEQQALWTLCRFGQYRGVGKHTTYGMGRLRILGRDERWQMGARLACWDAAPAERRAA